MRPGDEFERLAERIFKIMTAGPGVTVERDVQMPGADGPRQVDVLVRSSVGPIELTTIIECRDSKRKLNLTSVDGFHSKMQDALASKRVLVSRKGFSSKATQKAK